MRLTLQDRKGQLYYANMDGIKQLCLAWAHAAGKFRACSPAKEKSKGIGGQNFTYVNFDKQAYNSYKSSEAQRMFGREYFDPMLAGVRDYRDLIKKLVNLRQNTVQKARAASIHFESANDANRAALKQLERNLSNAKLARDLSASALVIGAAPVAGMAAGGFGAGTAVLATGSMLKGTAVYQDTGNIGLATIEVATEMTLGMVAVGHAATTTKELVKQGLAASGGGEAIMLLIMDVPMEGAKTIVAGNSLKQGFVAAATKATFGTLDVGGMIDEWSIPVIGKFVANVGLDKTTGVIKDEAVSRAKQVGVSDVNRLDVRGVMKKMPGVHVNHRASHRQFVLANCIRPV